MLILKKTSLNILFLSIITIFLISGCSISKTYILGADRESAENYETTVAKHWGIRGGRSFKGISTRFGSRNKLANFGLDISKNDPKYIGVTKTIIGTPDELSLFIDENNIASIDATERETEITIVPSLSTLIFEWVIDPKLTNNSIWDSAIKLDLNIQIGLAYPIHIIIKDSTYYIKMLDSDNSAKGQRIKIPITGGNTETNFSSIFTLNLNIGFIHLGVNALVGIEMPKKSSLSFEFGGVWSW